MTSKTNTEDLTLEPNQTKEYYENIFQETANKYIDNSYAISARTVNESDLDYFNYDNNFWLSNIDNTKITTSQSTWQHVQSDVKNYKMYVIPYIEKYFENYNEYNVGDIIEYSNNGVDRWVVAGIEPWNSSTLLLIPETPIELVIESTDDNISEKAYQITNSFSNDVSNYGNYVDYFGTDNLPNLIPNFLNQQTEKIWFSKYNCISKEGNKIIEHCEISYYENGEFGNASGTIYTEKGPKTLGYRPVVTLKVKKEIQDKDKKEISSKLQVGDNVKYEAKGYKNWKVLSIDNELGTVDIISGGIVKNLTLSGKEDWDNYEDIIQREVDEYKNGNNAKKATTVTSKDLNTLKIDNSVSSRYWLLSKNISTYNYFANGNVAHKSNYISTIYLNKLNNYQIELDSVVLYEYYEFDNERDSHYKDEKSVYTYTAGLRPIITLKLDSVEKLPDEETKKIEESTEKQEKVFIKEQESKNKDYKGPSKVDNSTSSTGNNEVKTNNNNDNTKDNIKDNNTSNVEKIVYKDKPFYKYGFYILLVICLIESLMLIIPKINKK